MKRDANFREKSRFFVTENNRGQSLTLTHLQGPLIMVWALGIGTASMAWLAELSVGAIQKSKKRVTNVSFLPKLQCFIL